MLICPRLAFYNSDIVYLFGHFDRSCLRELLWFFIKVVLLGGDVRTVSINVIDGTLLDVQIFVFFGFAHFLEEGVGTGCLLLFEGCLARV